MECKACGKEFGAKRKTAKYCSSRCRKLAFRVSVPEVTVPVIPENAKIVGEPGKAYPVNYGQPDCQCQHCKQNRNNGNRHTLNHGKWKSASELGDKELNRVSLPGDVDCVGVC